MVESYKTTNGKSRWRYDFTLLGERYRKGRFLTKKEAEGAERRVRDQIVSGEVNKLVREAFEGYMASIARSAAVSTLQTYRKFYDEDIHPYIGHLYCNELEAPEIDKMKAHWPKTWGAVSINQRLILVRAMMNWAHTAPRPAWRKHPIKIRMEKKPKRHVDFYSVAERDAFLQAIWDHARPWYCFFYVSMRLGLRRGEVYPIEHAQFRRATMQLVVDKAAEGVEEGTRPDGKPKRVVIVKPFRKGHDTLVLALPQDVLDVYDWHCGQGYAGKRLVFCPKDKIPVWLNSHAIPSKIACRKAGLRWLSHHKLGRHSVGSQADHAGEALTTIQRQLGHASPRTTQQYMHAHSDKAQRALMDRLRPENAPHERSNTVAPQELN